jgi:aspartate carbamoyltransferase regulatory subunit
VRKIEDGTVIDHVPAWKADLVLRVLRLQRLANSELDVSVAVLQNVISGRLGRKDVIKVDRWRIDESEADILCLIFPTATINYIRKWKVFKYSPRVPDTIEGRIRCPELLCISNAEREPLSTMFFTLKKERMLQCRYCDTLLDFGKIPDFVRV